MTSDTRTVQAIEYIHTPTRNPLRVARAAWRLARDLGATREATILEDAFSRSAWLRTRPEVRSSSGTHSSSVAPG